MSAEQESHKWWRKVSVVLFVILLLVFAGVFFLVKNDYVIDRETYDEEVRLKDSIQGDLETIINMSGQIVSTKDLVDSIKAATSVKYNNRAQSNTQILNEIPYHTAAEDAAYWNTAFNYARSSGIRDFSAGEFDSTEIRAIEWARTQGLQFGDLPVD